GDGLHLLLEIEALLAVDEAPAREAEETPLTEVREQFLIAVERDAELRRDLLLGGRTAQRPLELMRYLLDQARLLTHAARHPVERAEVIENRPPDAELRVGRERGCLLRVVLADRVQESDDPPRDEVAVLHVRRLPCCVTLHHAWPQR